MTLVDDLKPVVYSIRSIAGKLGLRPNTVERVARTYSGGVIGEGTVTTETITISESGGYPPKVRELNSEELALAGYERATWEIGPITPSFTSGGTAIATLTRESMTSDTEVHYVLTGPEFPSGANFRAVRIHGDQALHYMIQVQRVADSGT